MARRVLAVLVIVFAVAAVAGVFLWTRRPPAPPEAGIPESLAVERAARISKLRYEVTFQVPANRESPVAAHMRATFELRDTDGPISFDFAQPTTQLLAMHANTNIIEPKVEHQHITIPANALVRGENIVEFKFIAGDTALNRADEFLYALFVPARASQTMPVFDQPDLKARWKLVLNVPRDWTAVSNGKEIGRVGSPDHIGLVFEETAPISTYLFAFAAGKFSVETAERNGRTFRMLHRETDAAKVARNRDAVFDLHAGALAWLEDYTGIGYPFGKFDFVLIPSFQFGGMEHPGAVYYNASTLFLDESATQNQLLGRASLIAHETAHMWFGDFVTMKWFNDVWMKEVFANFMAAKIVNPSFPDVNHELRFLFQHYPSAYDVDRTEGTNPIRQRLSNLNEAGSIYGAIIYQKAPIVMRQLELLMGADAFRDGLRAYLKAHALGNATWNDLVTELDGRTPADLVAWSRAWVEERGRPRVTLRRETTTSGFSVAMEETDPYGRGLSWPQTIELAVGYPDKVDRIRIALAGKKTVAVNGANSVQPLWILPTSGGLGYGDFVLETTDLESLAAALPALPDPLLRGAALVTLWESMLESRISPDRVHDALFAALPKETDELNISQMLEYSRSLFWRFTAADDREVLGPALEALLRDGLNKSKTTSQKAAWFSAFRSVATTPQALTWLERVWRREEKIPSLPLAESDEADLALELAVRDVANAPEILATQLGRFKNADRKARFAFVQPALSSDPAARQAFFETLKNVANRRREAWVLEAARYLHHPLRAATSKRFVIEALSLVREIQQTGDIFFPKRWADVTLSGYQSPQTAADVRQFISELPADYPPRLRWVLQASADQMFRAAKILHQ